MCLLLVRVCLVGRRWALIMVILVLDGRIDWASGSLIVGSLSIRPRTWAMLEALDVLTD